MNAPDPTMKLTAPQRRMLDHPDVTYIGIDDRGRIVVRIMNGIPKQARFTAITKTATMIDIVPPVHNGPHRVEVERFGS